MILVAVQRDSVVIHVLIWMLDSVKQTFARMEGHAQLWECPLSAHAQKDTQVYSAKNQVCRLYNEHLVMMLYALCVFYQSVHHSVLWSIVPVN